MNTWRDERCGYRDEKLSERHGTWGFDCPAVDLDFVLVEYNRGKPCALIEYKHKNTAEPNRNHPSYKALVALANGCKIPCLIAIYDPDDWTFKVIPLNSFAVKYYAGCEKEVLTEQRWVKSLLLLRKRALVAEDEEVLKQLNGTVATV